MTVGRVVSPAAANTKLDGRKDVASVQVAVHQSPTALILLYIAIRCTPLLDTLVPHAVIDYDGVPMVTHQRSSGKVFRFGQKRKAMPLFRLEAPVLRTMIPLLSCPVQLHL